MKTKLIIFTAIAVVVAGGAFLVGKYTNHTDKIPPELIIDNMYEAVGECTEPRQQTLSMDGQVMGISMGMHCRCKARRLSDGAETVWISAMYPHFTAQNCESDDTECIEKETAWLTESCVKVCPYTCAAILKNVWQHGFEFKEPNQ